MLPLSWAFRGIVGVRRRLFGRGVLSSHSLPVAVIVVGNVSFPLAVMFGVVN